MPDYLVADSVIDTALTDLKTNVTKLVVCEGEPANYTEANTEKGSGGKKLIEKTVTSTDITLGDGPTDGRQATMAAFSAVSVLQTGSASHVAWLDVANTTILAKTLVSTPQSVTSGNTVNLLAHSIRGRDAVVAS